VTEESEERGPEERVLIWARPERATKGPAPSRSRHLIAAAAVALADAEGMEAVSIRRVAAALEIGAASMYGYIDTKDELYDLMVDWVEGEDGPPPSLSGDWRTDLTKLAHRIRTSMLRHPWMASVAAGRPNFGPNSLPWIEHGLAAMDNLAIGIDEMLIASEILQAFVRGLTTRELAEQQALQHGGLSTDERSRALAPYIDSVLSSGKYPHIGRVVRDADLPHVENYQDVIFTQGLERVLDRLLPLPVQTAAG
jgi:AcrR family transcriptional regulator